MRPSDVSFGRSDAADAAGSFSEGLRSHMLRVYNYMTGGLLLTGIIAMLGNPYYSFGVLAPYLYTEAVTPSGIVYGPSPLVWIAMIASLGLSIGLQLVAHKIKPATAQGLFWGYAAMNGLWMSSLLVAYTDASTLRVFFITAAAFAGLSIWGYTTKRNLGPLGAFAAMGIIGLIIAGLVNLFLQSSMLSFVISVVGVIAFAGLTAYDTQKIKDMYMAGDHAESAKRKAIYGALHLYIDFIGMFIHLMHLLGDRR